MKALVKLGLNFGALKWSGTVVQAVSVVPIVCPASAYLHSIYYNLLLDRFVDMLIERLLSLPAICILYSWASQKVQQGLS